VGGAKSRDRDPPALEFEIAKSWEVSVGGLDWCRIYLTASECRICECCQSFRAKNLILAARNYDAKDRLAAATGIDVDSAAVGLDDLIDDVQTKP
jgi:hypothetical protein